MSSFSDRQGITFPKEIQIADIDRELRASLWNVARSIYFNSTKLNTKDELSRISTDIYADFLKKPTDEVPALRISFIENIKVIFMSRQWWEVYNFVEFLFQRDPLVTRSRYETSMNNVLEKEKSAYRFVSGKIVPIINQTEVTEIKHAATVSGKFGSMAEHIKTSLELYARKPTPDYRNTIKEAISAVEATARIISGLPSATLGEALKKVDQKKPIHEAMRRSFLQLYGYTSDEGGIRHSLLESTSNVDENDARYMLVCCSAFCNYLISNYP